MRYRFRSYADSRAPEVLASKVWTRPENYAGLSPDGDYCILARTRDPDLLEDSNWHVATTVELDAAPYDPADRFAERPENFDDRPNVYHWRAGHWACGWVEYLMVRADAPDDVLATAANIVASLDDYPILSDDDYSEREFEAMCDAWESASVRERIEFLEGTGISVFAARRDELPEDHTGMLRERLIA